MIRVARVPQPTGFAGARRRGLAWLRAHATGTRPRDYWTPFKSVLADGFGGRCGYLAMLDPVGSVVWRDDERGGTLVFDEPAVMHCYTVPEDIEDDAKLGELGRFCRWMGRETNQGEVGLVVGDEYLAIRNLNEE